MKANVGELCLAVWQLVTVQKLLEQRLAQPAWNTMPISVVQHEIDHLASYLDDFEAATKGLGLRAVEDRLSKVRYRLAFPTTRIEVLSADTRVLTETAIDALRRHVFVHLPPGKSDFYSDPSLFYGESWEVYPSAQNDMASACRCYALGENTASVFHSMCVLQAGLYALANHLGLAFPTGIELEQWGTVISQIESEVERQRKATVQQQKGQNKDQLLEFYSNTGMQFSFFKDAWRNRVAHGRKSYGADEAHTILVHVKNFMVALSMRVTEQVPTGDR